MPSLHEIALLAAFISPVLVLVAINIFLMLAGEAGTLLMPRPMRFESVVIAEEPAVAEPTAQPELEPLRMAA
ncbi:MAG TPA: hypothetical protein VM051_06275 [Usitatibacter sp.]|nr:hypothetical protein [Usitatibacter sp.]